MIKLNKQLKGNILDIGGGGEGFIGLCYREQVTAIDNIQEELDEAPDVCKKLLMDARELKFSDAVFDNVTFFYSLMYMNEETQSRAIAEAARVSKRGANIFIWDAEIVSAYPDPFLIDVDVLIEGKNHMTTYGVIKNDVQSLESIQKLCTDHGLVIIEKHSDGKSFYLHLKK